MTFIGIGHNPDGPDLPLGLGMNLAQDPKAMDTFGKMTMEQKTNVINYIQSAQTGDDALQKINDAINRMHNGNMNF